MAVIFMSGGACAWAPLACWRPCCCILRNSQLLPTALPCFALPVLGAKRRGAAVLLGQGLLLLHRVPAGGDRRARRARAPPRRAAG